ncbi:MAG: alanine racemase [Candidatus Tagabacteria bacterium CG_4_8_14_3_um_filter_41_8]|uniref:Alanine racemase n=1 Tax=Candidatus Tagabacteria bacterium CG_4_8_14_3_um_filter_41_8 TaxID=1975018 RepID=A0A2M8G9B3_9BACT|nr:MAG: alanine racemase [Candidatus Tagabacteria bacterium CG_4_8_14_3_um_filter_41_8]
MKNRGLRIWIEINKKAAKNNYQIFRNLIGKNCLLMAVVKSNAYGHGLVDFSRLMQKFGIDWFGVDSITEALALRESGIKKKILVLGYTLPERLKDAAENNISLTVSSLAHLAALSKLKFRQFPRIHLKIDTGMHRQGFSPKELPSALNLIKKLKNKTVAEGIYTHFAAAKNPSFPADTLGQLRLFDAAVNTVKKAGFNPIRHASATSGTIIFPQAHYDLVRVGIGLYGLWPSKEVQAAFGAQIKLKPILLWKAVIGEIKKAARGERIGYDFTETLSRPTTIAVIPIGYWHGFPRALSGIGRVLIKNKPAKVLGRVSMDMISVDVSGIKAKIGDEAILIGKDGKNTVSADDIADLCSTSSYEIISRLNPLIKRIYC